MMPTPNKIKKNQDQKTAAEGRGGGYQLSTHDMEQMSKAAQNAQIGSANSSITVPFTITKMRKNICS